MKKIPESKEAKSKENMLQEEGNVSKQQERRKVRKSRTKCRSDRGRSLKRKNVYEGKEG